MAYLRFLLANLRSLSYGFLLSLNSTFGQTAFIAVYGGQIMALYALSPGEYGLLYMAATLTSAALMIPAGKLVDTLPRSLFTGIVLCGMALACLAMFFQAFLGSLLFLYLTLLLLRLFGQGLMSHAAMTAAARDFARNRGKALSIAGMGHAPGEAFFPLIAVWLMALIGWRDSWLLFAGLNFCVMLPLFLWLAAKRRVPVSQAALDAEAMEESQEGWTRAQVLRDPGFYFLLPVLFAAPCLGTGLFFHQVPLVESKGWALSHFAAGFTTFALSNVVFGLLAGKLIDRFSARWLLRFSLWPLAVGFLVIGLAEEPEWVYALMLLQGATIGMNHSIGTALWAELYGLANLGAIRALATSFMVFSTAIGPPVMGLLLDAGLAMGAVLLLAAAWTAMSALWVPFALRLIRQRRPDMLPAQA